MKFIARLLCFFVLAATASAQMQGDRLLFSDPGRRFSVEFPKDWKWELIAGAGEPLAVLIHPRRDAAIVVEHVRLPQPMERQDLVPAFAEAEAAFVRAHQSTATQIAGRVVTEGVRAGAVLDYVRTSLAGRERVRQYSFPVGSDLYRLTCMALDGSFARYEPVLTAIVQTFKPAGEIQK
jgi:hypothetical protein